MAFRKQAIKNESFVSVDMLTGLEISPTLLCSCVITLGKHKVGFLFDSNRLARIKRNKKEAQDSTDHSSKYK